MTVKTRKKLIEVALPLDAINAASAREKAIRHGHPSTLHLWWARRPLATARAVIFAQMVDDPSSHPEFFPTEEDQEKERQRLFRIIEELVLWESTTNEEVLQRARDEIWKSWRSTCADNADHRQANELFDPDQLPAFHDPFGGGGALPLEAQRLGLESFASDLNPVAVMIMKAMIEIPPTFAGKPPVNPEARSDKRLISREWKKAQGLAEDVRYYGQWMRDEAEKRIGNLYPKAEITDEMAVERSDLKQYVGQSLTVIAWIWARTVKSPNPAFASVDVPLASTFMLSTKAGKEAYVEPVIENGGYRFTVKVGKPNDAERAKVGTKSARANFACLMSGTPVTADYIKREGMAGRMGVRLMAVVAEGVRGRVYLAPSAEHEVAAHGAESSWSPEGYIATHMTGGNCTPYGLTTWGDLFTPRQLVALTTFSDLVIEARELIERDAVAASLPDDGTPLHDGGTGATAYAEAVSVYLCFVVDKCTDYWSSICSWHNSGEKIRNTFGRQAIPMVWDYAETNPFSASSGNWIAMLDWVWKALVTFPAALSGYASQEDAQSQTISGGKIVSTDPPYYDNIGYADLSDFFYVWMRLSLRAVFPNLFATVSVPKSEELVAAPYRHGGKQNAEKFFLDGMTDAIRQLARQAHPGFPVTIYYAFKQSETTDITGTSSTGWDTFLQAVVRAGFMISGTWPVRTEMANKIGSGSNMLASSIVLVCRAQDGATRPGTRREFISALNGTLPNALKDLQAGNLAPVDLAQAAIGPGMRVFTSYSEVIDAEGNAISVREALALINRALGEALIGQEGDFDADTRWALVWFDHSGFSPGEFGVAAQLSQSKVTSVEGMEAAGIIESGRGKVRLLRPDELDADWNPETDSRRTTWKAVHHLVRALESGGELAAAELVAKLGADAETARQLCYRLYTIAERKNRAADALSYNGLVQAWPEISHLAQEMGRAVTQGTLQI
jgi:putative DNA methylase